MSARPRPLLAALGAGALALTGVAPAVAAPPGPAPAAAPVPRAAGSLPAAAAVDRGSAIVQLSLPALTHGGGDRVDLAAPAAQPQELAAQRQAFKDWLAAHAPGAAVTDEFDASLNGVAVRLGSTPLAALRSAPGVVRAEYQARYTPLAEPAPAPAATGDPDLALVDATAAWDASRGDDVLVAVIDSGIDATHPCFDDAGYPAHEQLGDTSLTNNKVVVARVFSTDPGASPAAVVEHGTHVAGTIGCNEDTSAAVDGVPVTDAPDGYAPSGVAPKALLGNYNVFPGQSGSARSEDIIAALDQAVKDGADVVNMSLGGPPDSPDLLGQAVDNVDESGAAVVAVAAGNGGPGRMTVASPGSAARALTAGASSVGHFLAASLDVGGTDVRTAKGDFDLPSSPVTAPLSVVEEGGSLGPACNALPGGSLTGAIAVVARGSCVFSQKASVAKAAGAVAVVVVNNVAGDPVAMARSAGFDDALPAVMASLADQDTLTGANGSDATLGSELAYTRSSNSDIMGAFSGQGPTPGDFRVKPDVVAPGVNVLSSVPNDGWAFLQGTSMATPHLAGMAAVVRGAHPDWTPEQVRSAIVNTAATGRLKDFETGQSVVTDVNIVGAGIAQLAAAVNAEVALAPVSVSFGQVAPGVAPDPATITLSALTGSVPSDASVDNDAFAVSASGDTLTVTFDPAKADPGDGPGETATLTVGSAHAVLYAEVP